MENAWIDGPARPGQDLDAGDSIAVNPGLQVEHGAFLPASNHRQWERHRGAVGELGHRHARADGFPGPDAHAEEF